MVRRGPARRLPSPVRARLAVALVRRLAPAARGRFAVALVRRLAPAARGRLAVALAAVLALAGCGADEVAAPAGPSAAARPAPAATGVLPQPRVRPSAAVRARLAAGAVAVVDFRAHVAIAPPALAVNREQVLDGVRWTGWGDPRATGRGRVRTLVCDPTCAQGRIEYARGTLELAGVRLCGAGRFYATAQLRTTRSDAAPAVFLRTPC